MLNVQELIRETLRDKLLEEKVKLNIFINH